MWNDLNRTQKYRLVAAFIASGYAGVTTYAFLTHAGAVSCSLFVVLTVFWIISALLDF